MECQNHTRKYLSHLTIQYRHFMSFSHLVGCITTTTFTCNIGRYQKDMEGDRYDAIQKLCNINRNQQRCCAASFAKMVEVDHQSRKRNKQHLSMMFVIRQPSFRDSSLLLLTFFLLNFLLLFVIKMHDLSIYHLYIRWLLGQISCYTLRIS